MTNKLSLRPLYLAAAIALGLACNAATPARASAQFGISISVRTAPPPLPYYEQPILPGPDLVWEPGYWAWGPVGYFWVPGVWVMAPRPGLLWTPGYWAYDDAGYSYGWHPGYWGARVGYYGGVNYGFGYFGNGFVGGGWYGAHFRYNTAVMRVNTTIVRNVYVDRTVIRNTTYDRAVPRASFNGPGGVIAHSLPSERLARDQMVAMTAAQMQHQRIAGNDRNQLAAVNHDHPGDVAVSRPFTPESRPEGFTPVRPADRAAARAERVRPEGQRPNQVKKDGRRERPGPDGRGQGQRDRSR